jgi:hypothetical protein
MAARRVHRHGRRVRYVERADDARHVETGQRRDRLARLLPQALALGAKHQRDLLGPKTLFSISAGPSESSPIVWNPASCSSPSASARLRTSIMVDVLQRTRMPISPARQISGRAVARGCDQRAGAEGYRRAHDRADIVRVGNLVEHQDEVRIAKARKRLGTSAVPPREAHPDARRRAGEPVDFARFDDLGRKGQGERFGKLEPGERVACHQHAPRILRADCPAPPAPYAARRASPAHHRGATPGRGPRRPSGSLVAMRAAQARIVAVFGGVVFRSLLMAASIAARTRLDMASASTRSGNCLKLLRHAVDSQRPCRHKALRGFRRRSRPLKDDPRHASLHGSGAERRECPSG